ncbi:MULTISPECIES: DNA primase [unclassified Streptomyces]|uniref:DNA primase n=1 Tax=unclassified Streptomyces TaxID=2593676 RepID=UPI0007ED28C2|nr:MULTISPECIES: DNA primase [unclassified Streptomyces]MCP3767560.1 DNA primase [Streptomyces sp. MAR25Y5]OBQ53507.1 DNA primase [Streptomyces sp. H-KF8]
MNRTALGLAIGAGYFLGRTKKLKMAVAVGGLVAGKKLNLSPKMIGDLVSTQLRNNPQFKELGDQLRGDLRGAGKAASGALVERQLNALAGKLHGRTAEMRDQLNGAAGRPDREAEDDEYDEDEGAEHDEHDEDAGDDEPDGEEREAPPERPSKRASSKEGAKKAPAKKAPARKAPAKKTSAGKAAPAKKAAAKKTAAKKTTAARTASSRGTRSRTSKGGGE